MCLACSSGLYVHIMMFHRNGLMHSVYFLSLHTGQKMFKLHTMFLYDASSTEEMECLRIKWTSPCQQFLDVGWDEITRSKNVKLRMTPCSEIGPPLKVCADDCFGDTGYTPYHIG